MKRHGGFPGEVSLTKCIRMKNNSKGFTLIELIIGLAIMGILTGVLVAVLSAGGKSFRNLDENSSAENEARIAMSYITTQIRQNDAVTTTGGGIDVHNVKVTPAVPGVKPAQVQIAGETGVKHIYAVTGAAIDVCDLKESASDSWYEDTGASVIAKGLRNVTFTTFGAIGGNMGVKITVEYTGAKYSGVKKLEESIVLRAEGN